MPDPPPELTEILGSGLDAAREHAWSRFVERHTPLLLHVCRSLRGNHDDAMDRFAHLLEALRADDFRRLRAFQNEGRGQFSTWLLVVARRLCYDWDRTRYGRKREGETDETRRLRGDRRRIAQLLGERFELDHLAHGRDDAERELRSKQLEEILARSLEGLDPRDRLLLRLRFENELSVPRIARMMDFPTPFHVYRRLNALLRELRSALERRGVRGPEP